MSDAPELEAIRASLPEDLSPFLQGARLERHGHLNRVQLTTTPTPDQLNRITNSLAQSGWSSVEVRPSSGPLAGNAPLKIDLEDSPADASQSAASQDASTQEPDQTSDNSEELAAEKVSDQTSSIEEDAKDRLSAIQAQVKALTDDARQQRLRTRMAEIEVRRLERNRDELSARIQGIQESRESLEEWVLQRRDSFAWQFVGKLARERRSASRDYRDARNQLESGRRRLNELLVPSYRKPRFLLKALTSVVIAIVLVSLIQVLARDTDVFGNLRIPDALAMSGFAGLLLMGILFWQWMSLERAKASQALRTSHENRTAIGDFGLDMGQHALMLISLTRNVLVPVPFLIALVLFVEYLATVLPNAALSFVPSTLWLIFIALAMWIVAILGAWWAYYQQLSRLRGLMLRSVHEAKWQQSRYLHARREEYRLEAMHALVPEYLELLGRAMHAPWKVDASLVESHRSDPPVDVFPAAVSLAQAHRGFGSADAQLMQQAFSSAYYPGWLSEAFDDLLRVANEREGALENRVDREAIYADPGDSLRGPRKRAIEGMCSEEVRLKIGRSRLPVLADTVQKHGIRNLKPAVLPLRDSGLGDVQVSTSRFRAEDDELESWDDFLARALTPAAPFSLITFDPMKLSQRPTRIHRSHVLAPQELLDDVSGSEFDVIAEDDDAGAPLDWVIRVDRSDWLDPEVLRLFSRHGGTAAPPQASPLQEDKERRASLPEG